MIKKRNVVIQKKIRNKSATQEKTKNKSMGETRKHHLVVVAIPPRISCGLAIL